MESAASARAPACGGIEPALYLPNVQKPSDQHRAIHTSRSILIPHLLLHQPPINLPQISSCLLHPLSSLSLFPMISLTSVWSVHRPCCWTSIKEWLLVNTGNPWVPMILNSTSFWNRVTDYHLWIKQSGVKYPNMYASAEEAKSNPQANLLNCAQRAHGNTLENTPSFLFALTFSGMFRTHIIQCQHQLLSGEHVHRALLFRPSISADFDVMIFVLGKQVFIILNSLLLLELVGSSVVSFTLWDTPRGTPQRGSTLVLICITLGIWVSWKSLCPFFLFETERDWRWLPPSEREPMGSSEVSDEQLSWSKKIGSYS